MRADPSKSVSPTPAPAAPNIVAALAALLACQLVGEVLVQSARLLVPGFAFPGPVAGMAILFAWLVARGGPGPSLDATCGAILRNLSLLFVPAAVGVVQYGPLLADYGLALLAALIGSTLLTLLVTVGVFIAVARRSGNDDAA